ncbi:SCA7, zinc-binding domain-containing protein [Geopyxis carbonaria]|nr:SCA7, zinc-binding domain-containing protein [Geopyxis carbonaria]
MNHTEITSLRTNDAVLKLFNEDELTSHIVKLKAPLRKTPLKPSTNWKERARELESQDDRTTSPIKSPGPVVTQLDEKDISTFATGRPLHDELDYTVCKHCKKPVIRIAAIGHIKACLKAKQERTKERKKLKEEKAAAAAKDKDITVPNVEATGDAPPEDSKKKGAKKMAKKEGDGTKGKKRKADEAKLPKEPKAKKKKEKPAKPDPKPKAPVDVEKQCGVQLPNGALCARSLTCKSHSMGAKRGVLGRSQPYDVLLAAYQKKNQAKQQKAAINAGAPPPDEIEANAMPVDSDEETELVMSAISRHHPRPLVQPMPILVRKKSQYVRMREMMSSALRPIGQPMFNTDTVGPTAFSGAVNQKQGIGIQPAQIKSFQSLTRKSSLNVAG